jgi:bacteriorhodopsin
MNAVAITAIGSLVIQLITGVIEASGLFLKVSPTDQIIKSILTMELLVQAVEFIFYSYMVFMILTNHVGDYITSHRYIDWAITTPFMLISFVLFFKYLAEPTRIVSFWESIEEERETLIKIVVANAAMLLFGFLAERRLINTTVGVTLGFIPFIYMFYTIYDKYAKKTESAKLMYYVVLFIWSLYGVAAYLPFVPKNTMYNILDLFAKNAYGLFLYIYLRSVAHDSRLEIFPM